MSTNSNPRLEVIHTAENDPSFNLPYAPAIKVTGGRLLFTAAMAAPTYHHHPHRPEEFDHLPEDPGEQARMPRPTQADPAAAGGTLQDVVFVTRFIRDIAENQDAINRVFGEYFGDHRPSSCTVEAVRCVTDPRLKFEMSVVAVVPE